MLTADLVRPRLRLRGPELSIALLDRRDPFWLRTATDLIALLQGQAGQSQADWERAVEAYAGERVDYLVVRGLAKVLADGATFAPRPTPLPPAQLRERLFTYGPVFSSSRLFHPRPRYEVVQDIAAELAISADQVEATLFADRPAAYVLRDEGPAWTPDSLLDRYNLELARGVLYWASQVQVEVRSGYQASGNSQTHLPTGSDRAIAGSSYKDLWRYLKLFKLMFWAQALPGGGYRLDLDGPISPFVSSTLRYGRQLAAFLPALLLCEQWRMVATVHPPQAGRAVTYRLDHTAPLRTHFKQSGLFDSRLEADFADEFAQKMGGKRGHWRLIRESEVLLLGDTVMIPDFTLVDDQDENRKIMIELVGFWHPQYLRRKLEKVQAAQCARLLLLVYKGLNISEDAFQDTVSQAIFFQQKPVLKEVMETVEAMADRIYGPRQQRRGTRANRRRPKRSQVGYDANAHVGEEEIPQRS